MTLSRKFVLYLAPILLRAFLGVAILPLTTHLLDPADFGLFALISGFTAIGAAIATSGTGYVVAAFFPEAPTEVRREMISTLLAASLGAGLLLASGLMISWPWLMEWLGVQSPSPTGLMPVALLLTVLPIPWAYAMQIIPLSNRATAFSIITVIEAIATTATTLSALYAFSMGVLALFLGILAAALVDLIGALIILAPYLRTSLSMQWLRRLAGSGTAALTTMGVERLQILAERTLLSRYTGLAALGLYSHSQSYRAYAMMGVKSLGYSVWPISLAEARVADGRFEQTGKVWNFGALGVSLAGIFLAAFGRDVISILTHGKFTEAYILATLWMSVLLIQNTGRAAVAFLFTANRGVANQNAQTACVLISIGLLFVLVPTLGIYGAFIAAVVQVAAYRMVLALMARRDMAIPFQDGKPLLAILLVLATLGASIAWPAPVSRGFSFLAACGALAWLFRAEFILVLGRLGALAQSLRRHGDIAT